jgi:hypothetical protein
MKYLIIFLLFFIVGCKSQKTTFETSIAKKDSISLHVTKTVLLPVISSIEIERPCDSVKGLKPFVKKIASQYANVEIRSRNNALFVELTTDTISQEDKVSRQISEKSSTHINQIETTSKYIPKWVWWSVVFNAGSILWIFRKFVPFLRFIK